MQSLSACLLGTRIINSMDLSAGPPPAGEVLVNKQMPTNTRDPVTNPAAMPDAFYRNAPVMWKGYSGGEKCVVDKVGWAPGQLGRG